MAIYKYEVITSKGESLEGTYDAKNKEEVLSMLRENRYYPVNIKRTDEEKDIRNIKIMSKVKAKDIAIFCRQFYTMLNAGVTIISCLDILRQQIENKRLKQTVGIVYEEVQKGLTFSEALQDHKDVFPELLINMVEAGEVSGNLDTIMDRMADHYEKEFKINNKIKGAMVYPIILSIVAIGVVIFLLTFVMPTFMQMFEGSNVPLPAPTRFLLALSNMLKQYWYLFIGGSVLIVIGIRRILKVERVRFLADKAQLKFPIIKGITEKIVTSRFTRTLSTLSSSGVPLLQSMEIVANVVGNKVVGDGLNTAKEEIRKGVNLSQTIKDIGVFPIMVTSMIEVGEESGSLDEILEKTAAFYDEELEAAMQKLTTMIEPLMIVVMAVMIGFIVVSMVMPMFDMFGALDM
ncbi:MAG TPA: type II secretion system F family protein [Anaerovoracaceae bacterium]|nr:type II secretion system F family protein [Anaerovoracaceae bacterium]